MPDLPTQAIVWGDLNLTQLKIRGASYATKQTPQGPISTPTVIVYGHGKRRWRLLVLDVVELPPQGSKDPDPPIPQSNRQFLYDEVMAQRERARIAERRVKELEERLSVGNRVPGHPPASVALGMDVVAVNASDVLARPCDTCAKVPGKCEGCGTGNEHWVQRRPV